MSLPRKGFPLTIEDCPKIPLNNPSKWHIQGFSRAGERTSFRLDPYNILLDAGLCSIKAPQSILLTHSHIDHTWNLPSIAGGIKTNNREEKISVYFPQQSYVGLTKLLEASSILSYPEKSFSEKEVWERHILKPYPVFAGDIFYIKNIKIEVAQAVHISNSFGYGFSTTKSKLKKEYREFIGNDKKLIELRKSGIELSEQIEQPEFIFYCDSKIENLTRYDSWKKYPSVIVECTGYPEIYSKEHVREISHTHIEDLLPIIESNRDKNWFLIHASMQATKELLDKWQNDLNHLNAKILSNI